ncbi:hypothetical protein HG537_0E00370 [Torulaspora globosa]|uniref:Lem3/Cdc50 n=1 Tax=Torulaspora globosa TaxID=48254 RepID=A0A7H9HSH2_9SACH|nr:hypothetical protein HG537_0E00370 [Torulaspora sp. CBS 2947]
MVNFNLSGVGVFKKKDVQKDVDIPEEDDVDASEFEEDEVSPKPVKSRRPLDTPFSQQRLASWNPVPTPRSVIPLYVFVAAIFVIVGGCLLSVASKVSELTIYYQDCTTKAPSGDEWADMPADHYSMIFAKNKTFSVAPQWRYVADPDDHDQESGTCQIRFTTPHDIPKDVYVNYLIENFAANHRRYVLSFSEDQIRGRSASRADIQDNVGINCKVLGHNAEGKLYYPCGLIANSMFNDTFPFQLTNVNDPSSNYSLSNTNINWHTDKTRFKKTKYNPEDIVPPPYWERQFPNGYNETNIPNIHEWEEFQNWMRPAALHKFAKLIRRNSNESLPAGEYQIDIGLHWPVLMYNGKKAVYITHGSSIGSRNYFLGIAYLIGGCILAAFALILLGFWLLSGRKIADPSYLSWNRS